MQGSRQAANMLACTLLSHSRTGWGVFMHGDGARKDEFIGEYTGDLITQVRSAGATPCFIPCFHHVGGP